MLASETSAVHEGLRLERIGVVGPENVHASRSEGPCAPAIAIPWVCPEQLITKAGGDSKKTTLYGLKH